MPGSSMGPMWFHRVPAMVDESPSASGETRALGAGTTAAGTGAPEITKVAGNTNENGEMVVMR